MQVSFQIKQNRGIHSEEIAFYDKAVETNLPLLEKSSKSNQIIVDSTDTYFELPALEGNAIRNQGILIYKGMGIQVFNGDIYTAKPATDVANH